MCEMPIINNIVFLKVNFANFCDFILRTINFVVMAALENFEDLVLVDDNR